MAVYERELGSRAGNFTAQTRMKLTQARLTSLLRSCVGAFAISIVGIAVLLSINIWAATLDRSAALAHVRSAFASDALGLVIHRRTNTREGAHQFNDCLILYMVLDTRGPAIKRGLSPLNSGSLPQDAATYNPCEQLRALVFRTVLPPVEPTEFYHRYIHGQVAAAAILLKIFSLPFLRFLFDLASFLSVAGLVGASLWQVWAASRSITSNSADRSALVRLMRGVVIGTISLVLLAFFGLQFYGMSLSHFPSDATVIAYLWLACCFDLGRLNTAANVAIHSILGLLTAYFELLTGGIPLGICLIFLAFIPHAVGSAFQAVDRAVVAVAAFMIAVVSAFVVKVTFASIVFQENLFPDLLTQLGHRARDGSTGLLDLGLALLAASHYLGAGWRVYGAFLLLASVVAFAAGLYRLARAPVPFAPRAPVLLIAGAFLSIVGWYFVMLQHSHQHNFFMVRIAVGMIASSLMMFALGYRREITTVLTAFLTLNSDAADSSTQQRRASPISDGR